MFFGQKFPKSEAAAKGSSLARCSRTSASSARCRLLLLTVLRDALRQLLGRVMATTLGHWHRRSSCSLGVGVHDQVLDRLAPALRPVHHPRPGRRGRTRHGRLDPEHHRQPPHLRSRARSSSSGPRRSCSACASAPTSSRPSSKLSPIGLLFVCSVLACSA